MKDSHSCIRKARPECSLGCHRPVLARGLCRHCYKWASKRKLLTRRSIAERFWAKVRRAPSRHPVLKTFCLLWTAAHHPDGYGSFGYSPGVIMNAQRAAWILRFGSIPENIHVLHKCDVPSCVNVEHLFLGTQNDNNKDAGRKGRLPWREKHHNNKYTRQLVRVARQLRARGNGFREIAERMSIPIGTIYGWNTNRWQHL